MKKIKLILNFALFFGSVTALSSCSPDDQVNMDENGEVSLEINITVPSNVAIDDVLVTGPNGYQTTLNTSTLLEELDPGTYNIMANIKIVRGEPISLAYRPQILKQSIEINSGQQTVDINYQLMPGSGKIWFSNQNASSGRKIIGFDRNDLSASGNIAAEVILTESVTAPEGLAFDPLGNLWVVDGAGQISRFDWDDLGSSNVSPSKSLSIDGMPFSLAFDADTTLWVTTFNKITGFTKEAVLGNQSAASIEITSPDFNGLKGLAFDASGNLWVANASSDNVIKLSASKLQSSGNVTPDLSITCQSPPPVVNILSEPTSIAFDDSNNMWIGYFGPNTIAKITPAQRTNTVEFEPAQFNLDVFVLVEHMAFDESSSLWLPFGEDFFARIPETGLNSGIEDVSIESDDSRYLTGVAVYPIPAGLPMK